MKKMMIALLSVALTAGAVFARNGSFGANAYASSDWVDRYSPDWDSPSNDVADSMPFAAGDIGCNVWVDDGDLLLYVQRSGAFNELGEYCKLGRIRLSLQPNPFINYNSFSQKLQLKDGYVSIQVKDVHDDDVVIKFWIDQFTHSVHVAVDAEKKIDYKVAYETWRFEDKEYTPSQVERDDLKTNIHNRPSKLFGSFSFIGAPFDVIKKKDTFEFEGNTVVFYHRNSADPLSPRIAIEQQGLTPYKDQLINYNANRTFGGKLFADNAVVVGAGSGRYLYTDFKSLVLQSKSPATNHHIMLATHVAQTENLSEWKSDLDKQVAEVNASKGNFEKNQAWWRAFWQRSWISIEPDHKNEKSVYWQMGRNYNLARYMMGVNANGEFPMKFNGLNYSYDMPNGFDPDWRGWGGDFFTAQNQRLIYLSLLKSGDYDAFKPQFDLYKNALNGAKIRCREYFGHDGAVFCENTDATGLQLPYLYGWYEEGNKYRRVDIPFGDPRIREDHSRAKGYRVVERGVSAHPAMSYHHQAQLEFSYMILEYYSYSGLSIEPWYEFIKQSMIFFDQHFQKRKVMRDGSPLDENGKLVIYPSQALENYRIAKNPVDLIAGLHACLNELEHADFVSKEDKTYYRELLKRIPPLPFGEIKGQYAILPAAEVQGGGRKESPQFYPLFPYNRFSLDDPEMEAFRNTWKLDKRIRKDDKALDSWFQNGIFLARMGLVDECVEYQFKKLGDNEEGRRFPAFWGPGLDAIVPDGDRVATAAIGLQEMLLQNIDDKIYVLPCWEEGVDVDFKLHAPQQTTVEVSYRNGKIEKLIVVPASRKKDVVIRMSR